MPRGGENHAQGGEKSLRGEKISRAQDSIFLPPLGNLVVRPYLSCLYIQPLIHPLIHPSISLSQIVKMNQDQSSNYIFGIIRMTQIVQVLENLSLQQRQGQKNYRYDEL